MIINKGALDETHCRASEYYYESAREGMYDLLNNMSKKGLIDTLFLPGYIGWSPKEGSGIFDSIDKIDNLSVNYYKMTEKLNVDTLDLFKKIENHNNKFAVLVVNYFGFIDPQINNIISKIKKHNGWVIEDNAHGFFTHLCFSYPSTDATFFSLHKMFPFKKGGSVKITNNSLKNLKLNGESVFRTKYNPWIYDVKEIVLIRRRNYEQIHRLIDQDKYSILFEPLKGELETGIIPQTYPIVIKKGSRDKIYDLMNDAGFGVVSLYHTLIEPLRKDEYADSLKLSKHILNLPVHQDVDSKRYEEMVSLLARFCVETK